MNKQQRAAAAQRKLEKKKLLRLKMGVKDTPPQIQMEKTIIPKPVMKPPKAATTPIQQAHMAHRPYTTPSMNANPKIRIYYHVYAVNHYLDIIKEQLQTIYDCGLYDECQDINVGFLGSDIALSAAQEIFNKYPKVKVAYHSTNGAEYEFATMKIMKRDCDTASELFFGVYLHTKSVSYPPSHHAFLGGQFWRHYMMDYVIKRWRNNYKALNLKYMGYDICGVKVVPARVSPSNRTHISGTFFAFNSEYIRSLCKVEHINNNNRFECEQWPTSGQPLIYTPCQLFVDYNAGHPSYDEFMKNYTDLHQFEL